MPIHLLCALLGFALLANAQQLQCPAAPSTPEPWREAHQTPQCRTLELIHAMSLEEKLAHISTQGFGAKPQPDRFGIPLLNPNDGPNGFAKGPFPGPPSPSALGVTAFPNEIVLAATWDRQRASDFGKALGEEWRGKGSSEIIAPTLNIMRTWHWGRSAETFGEDPFLTGQMAAAEVEGLQKEHVIAMIKHFSANNQDWDRVGHHPDFTGINEIIPERALHEIYYPGFREAIQSSDAAGVMCSYNQINGTFACNNEQVLSQLKQWGFSGAVTPDAVFALHDPLAALKAGVTYVGPAQLLNDLLSKGKLSEQKIDSMLYDVLLPIFKLGIYDTAAPGNPTARVSTPAHVALAKHLIEEGSVLLKNNDHLLPIVPGKVKTIAVIGAAAGPQAVFGEEGPTVWVEKLSVPSEAIAARCGSAIKVSFSNIGSGIRALPLVPSDVLSPPTGTGHGLTGTYFRSGDRSGDAAVTRLDANIDINSWPAPELGQMSRSFGPPKLSWSARWTGRLTPPVTGDYVFSLDGMGTATLSLDGKPVCQLLKVNFTSAAFGTAHLVAGQPVTLLIEHSNDYAVLGSDLHLGWTPPQADEFVAALHAAESADLAIVFAGEQLGEGMDKTQLNLPGDQDALIEAVAAHNPHTVVVLNTSTPVAMPWLDNVQAVLEAWYPGQESGVGIASLLFGDADPAGRLPVTFPASAEQGPAAKPEAYPGVNGIARYDEGILVGYRWYDHYQQTPLFPFGHGLSYTDFQYSNLRVHRSGASISLSVAVKNVGSRPGSDVVQLYVADPTEAAEPPSQLKGFEKVRLAVGESKTVNIEIPVNHLATWSEEAHAWKISKGTYEFKVGQSSRQILLRKTLEITSP